MITSGCKAVSKQLRGPRFWTTCPRRDATYTGSGERSQRYSRVLCREACVAPPIRTCRGQGFRVNPSTLPQAAPQGKAALVWRENTMVKGRKGFSGVLRATRRDSQDQMRGQRRSSGMLTPEQAGAQPFDSAPPNLRMNRAAARFTSSAPTSKKQNRPPEKQATATKATAKSKAPIPQRRDGRYPSIPHSGISG